jgi:hypothetical protein
VFRKRFFAISDDPDAAFRAGISVRAWDFLFYLTFGVVITLSTRVAGVLLVFVFLVAPAILAFLLTRRLWLQLLIGWTTGTLVTIAGLYLSWKLDLPSGPAVIAFYGVALVIGGLAIYLWRAEHRARAVRSTLLGLAISCVVVLAVWGLGRRLGGSTISWSDEAKAVHAQVTRDQVAASSREAEQRDDNASKLRARISRCVGGNKVTRHLSFPGPEERLAHARLKLGEDVRRGLEFLLIALADDETPLLYREEGVALLAQYAKGTFGYDAQVDAAANEQAIARICDHVHGLKFSARSGAARDPGK